MRVSISIWGVENIYIPACLFLGTLGLPRYSRPLRPAPYIGVVDCRGEDRIVFMSVYFNRHLFREYEGSHPRPDLERGASRCSAGADPVLLSCTATKCPTKPCVPTPNHGIVHGRWQCENTGDHITLFLHLCVCFSSAPSVNRGVSTTIVVSIGNMETLGEGAMATILYLPCWQVHHLCLCLPRCWHRRLTINPSPSVPLTSTQAWECPSDLDLRTTPFTNMIYTHLISWC